MGDDVYLLEETIDEGVRCVDPRCPDRAVEHGHTTTHPRAGGAMPVEDDPRNERIAKVGRVEVWGRRRGPDDPVVRHLEGVAKAVDNFRDVLLATGPGKAIQWTLDRLERFLNRKR